MTSKTRLPDLSCRLFHKVKISQNNQCHVVRCKNVLDMFRETRNVAIFCGTYRTPLLAKDKNTQIISSK